MQGAKRRPPPSLPCRRRVARIGARSGESRRMMADLTLYIGNKNYSSWSLRAWLALKHAGARFEEVLVPLRQAESPELLRRHSPSCRVPALHHGDFVVWESLAICEYGAELFPEARLWPEDRETRAVARAIANEMHGGFANMRNHLPMD